jgi:glycine cleavage system regulatory protein
MGATVTGLVSTSGKSSSIVIVITGKADPACVERLKLEIQRLARECGLGVRLMKVSAKKKARKKAGRKARKKARRR